MLASSKPLDVFAVQGMLPAKDEVIRCRNMLLSAEDLRSPMNLNLQLMKSAGLSSDVGQAMAELLLVRPIGPACQSKSLKKTGAVHG